MHPFVSCKGSTQIPTSFIRLSICAHLCIILCMATHACYLPGHCARREMYTGKRPWTRDPSGSLAAHTSFGAFNRSCPSVYRELCQQCLSVNLADRPTFNEVSVALETMMVAWIYGQDDLRMPRAPSRAPSTASQHLEQPERHSTPAQLPTAGCCNDERCQHRHCCQYRQNKRQRQARHST